jgi:hypothetical protein
MLEKMAITTTRTVISGTVLTSSKVTVKNVGRGGRKVVKMLAAEYIYRTSSSKLQNHKSQLGTRVQQRTRN